MKWWVIAAVALCACSNAPTPRPAPLPPPPVPAATTPPPTVATSAATTRPPTPRPFPSSDARADAWPIDERATWPAGCLIQWATMHPTLPWLAVGCTSDWGDPGHGAVVVIDVDQARLRTVTHIDHWVCGFEDSLVWHPDGTRIAVNIETNSIATVERGELVAKESPDDGRDHGFDMLWYGDRVVVDLGGFLGKDFELVPIRGGTPMTHMAWNAATQSVVGFDGDDFVSYSPAGRGRRFRVSRTPSWGRRVSGSSCRPDGRMCVTRFSGTEHRRGRRRHVYGVALHDGDDGRLLGELKGSLPSIDHLSWSPTGRLAWESYDHRRVGRVAAHIDIVEDARIVKTIDLGRTRLARGGGYPSEGGLLAWNRPGDTLGVLVDEGDVLVFNAKDGHKMKRFRARPAAVPAWMKQDAQHRSYSPASQMGGLLATTRHFVRLSRHFVAIYTVEGERRAEWVSNR